MNYYGLRLRPPSFGLPQGWELVARPWEFGDRRADLPRDPRFRFGVIAYDEPLDAELAAHLSLDPCTFPLPKR